MKIRSHWTKARFIKETRRFIGYGAFIDMGFSSSLVADTISLRLQNLHDALEISTRNAMPKLGSNSTGREVNKMIKEADVDGQITLEELSYGSKKYIASRCFCLCNLDVNIYLILRL